MENLKILHEELGKDNSRDQYRHEKYMFWTSIMATNIIQEKSYKQTKVYNTNHDPWPSNSVMAKNVSLMLICGPSAEANCIALHESLK